jgi:hypothetical protein
MSDEMKTCPSCAEEVKAAARKCKHCGDYFDGYQPTPAPPAQPVAQPAQPVAPQAQHTAGQQSPARRRAKNPQKKERKCPNCGSKDYQTLDAFRSNKWGGGIGCIVVMLAIIVAGPLLLFGAAASAGIAFIAHNSEYLIYPLPIIIVLVLIHLRSRKRERETWRCMRCATEFWVTNKNSIGRRIGKRLEKLMISFRKRG